jgi:phage portal protein BeeE
MANNFLTNFFGLNSNTDYLERFINQVTGRLPHQAQIWGKKEAVWVDTNDSWRLFIEIPELRAVIDKRASMMASNIPCLYDMSGDKVESHWILDLIKTPNAVQSWSDVIYSLSVQDALYSNAFAYVPKRSFDIRNLIVPLPADKVEIYLSGKKLKQMDSEDLITKFKFQYDDDSKELIDWTDMLYLNTNDGMNIIKPISRVDSLKYPLSNLKAQYHKRNVLLENIGAIGILSTQSNDMGGAIPMTPEEKKAIQKDWYKRSKDELIITESNVDWKPMSYPTKDLMLFEELTADKLAIIDAYGLNANIFSSERGTTFNNVKESIKMCYTDTIIPETQSMYDSIMKQWGLADEYYLKADFSHLPSLQEDEEAKANVQKTKAETLEKIQAMGVQLSEEEIRVLTDLNNEEY